MTIQQSPNVGVAFALVAAAGAATALGASVVFFPSLVKLASRRVLAAALGFSAGVMVYVSFVEIFIKSNDSFLEAGFDEKTAYLYATLCFFGGVVSMLLIDFVVRFISAGDHDHHHHPTNSKKDTKISESDGKNEQKGNDDESVGAEEVLSPHCVGCIDDPVGELEEWQKLAEEEVEVASSPRRGSESQTTDTAYTDVEGGRKVANKQGQTSSSGKSEVPQQQDADVGENKCNKGCCEQNKKASDEAGNEAKPGNLPEEVVRDGAESISSIVSNSRKRSDKKLVRMGINTAVAIGLHNFPEGLATFVAALDDPRVGAVLAIAIGVHNVPEGLCVSLPIYYATGNRWKAFLWALLSGMSEPIAALLGWLVLASVFSEKLYGVLFGLVAGMMVIISVKELLPTAHRYDANDTVVTYSVITGMGVMALSLVLFKL